MVKDRIGQLYLYMVIFQIFISVTYAKSVLPKGRVVYKITKL